MSLKESIERELQIPTRIRFGGPGSLDIFADGEKVYSKKQTGRMPSAPEVVSLLRARMNP
ncbi:MAG TPA: Rdx family protein [Bryobacteraceae bacterium]|nr:Rdx family protein [Bryobacteraceae bacterium]